MGPNVSIIVPVYKAETYLHDCVESILSQSFRDFELILVDDGSPDNSGKICDEYARRDDRIIVIHQENQGQAGARNTALDIAKGEYITFIDSDDIVNDQYLEKLLDVMQDDTDITVCKFHHFERTGELSTHNENRASYKNYDGESIAIAIFNGEISAGPCGKLYRTGVINDTRFPVGRIHEDVVFTPIVCYLARKAICINEKLYYYRQHNSSTIHSSFSIKRYDAIWATDECIRFFEDQNKPEIVNAARRKREYYLLTYTILAWKDKVTVPKEYRMSLLRAIVSLRKLTSDDYFEYYLAQIHPKLAMAHEYWKKSRVFFSLKSKKQ